MNVTVSKKERTILLSFGTHYRELEMFKFLKPKLLSLMKAQNKLHVTEQNVENALEMKSFNLKEINKGRRKERE
jgi:hypothetical protein